MIALVRNTGTLVCYQHLAFPRPQGGKAGVNVSYSFRRFFFIWVLLCILD